MATPVWQPGTLYNPGALVQRASAIGGIPVVVTNPSFEDGSTGWTLGAGWETTGQQHFQGNEAIRLDSTTGGSVEGDGGTRTTSDDIQTVYPGQSITAEVYIRTGQGSAHETFLRGGRLELDWLDENQIFISRSQSEVLTGNSNPFRKAQVTGVAPAGAAFVQVSLWAFRSGGNERVYFDAFSWNYIQSPGGENLVFRAVQPDAGFSGATEPVWPSVNGQQVVDNEVIWEALDSSRVTWEAQPILVSDYLEPDWPTWVDGSVVDNTIVWTAISRRVVDTKCPNSIIVAIAASKVFAGDDDIIGFSATVNPLDWTTSEDAGYLPFGLQTFGANPVTALGLYRSNLIAFNSEGYQMWQIDEDPENMAILDAQPIGCIHPKTLYAVHNDLVFLSTVGIRNIGIAGASTNLQAGTFGAAVDPLVQAAVRAAEYDPIGLFVPSLGQYWCIFGDEAFVLTISDTKQMSWSRYTFPEAITDWTIEGGNLLLRTATHKIWRVDAETTDDDHFCEAPTIDLPYMPETLGSGTLEIDASYVLDRRNGSGGTFSPDSYGGNPVNFDPPAYALVLQDMEVGAGDLSCVIHGLDEDGNVAQETITFDAETEYRYIVGSQLFSRITSIVQSGITSDQQFSVGYQRYIADEEAEELTVTIHGYWAVSNSDGGAVENNGLFVPEVDTAQELPGTSVLVVRRNANTTTTPRVYTETDGEVDRASVTLPAGSTIGQVVIGAEELDEIYIIERSGSGGVNPFVDIGIQFQVATECTGQDIIGVIQWPFLDWGTLGVEKELVGFDLVCEAPEGCSVSIGYNQRNRNIRTAAHTLTEADTLPGQMVPFPVTAPSFDFRIEFAPGQQWEWSASNLYIMDRRFGR